MTSLNAEKQVVVAAKNGSVVKIIPASMFANTTPSAYAGSSVTASKSQAEAVKRK